MLDRYVRSDVPPLWLCYGLRDLCKWNNLITKIILSIITNMFVIMCPDLKLMGGFTYIYFYFKYMKYVLCLI